VIGINKTSTIRIIKKSLLDAVEKDIPNNYIFKSFTPVDVDGSTITSAG